MAMQDEFLQALAKDEDDADTRLVYADWLDEHGQHEEADRQRKWPAAKEWLVAFCQDFFEDDQDAIADDPAFENPYSYFYLSYEMLVKLGQEALQLAHQSNGLLYFDCGANESLCDVLCADSDSFWSNLSVVTGVPLPRGTDTKSIFSCSC